MRPGSARARATAEGKRILLIVGGDWCSWCGLLDRFIASHGDVHAALMRSFVIIDVNSSRENPNSAFLRQYGAATGYPDFIVLESDGSFLAAQDTEPFEQGHGYSADRLIAFAQRWKL